MFYEKPENVWVWDGKAVLTLSFHLTSDQNEVNAAQSVFDLELLPTFCLFGFGFFCVRLN